MSASAPMTWKTALILPVVLVFTLSPIGCSNVRPIFYDTGSDYIVLQPGQTFTAPRAMTLATESAIQKKDQQILDLQKVCNQLLRESQFKGN